MTKKKMKKLRHKHMLRNAAAPGRSLPRAVVVRHRGPTAAEQMEALEAERAKKNQPDTSGWRALKAFGGALATTVAGAYLARQDWLPPKVMTGTISALGALLALEGPEKLRSLGLGAMSAAGGQLGFMLIDDQLVKHAEDREPDKPMKPPVASGLPAPQGKRQASDIPADALARAYERARLRMALAHDAPN